jgi:hypothetical protein
MWEEEYFFADLGSRAVCLICDSTVSVFKMFNLKCHFILKQEVYCSNLSCDVSARKAKKLVSNPRKLATKYVYVTGQDTGRQAT